MNMGFRLFIVLNISVISSCRFLSCIVTDLSFSNKVAKLEKKIFIGYSQGSLVQPIDFVVHLPAMKHPNQRTVLELAGYKSPGGLLWRKTTGMCLPE